ncbi:MAG: SRPBCC family protein [Acidimicrobiales bacterium]|jgi:uncharacterized protein YndB with AHSA1/START domain
MTTNETDGTIEEVGDTLVLRFERRYSNSINDVWDAITNPERIAQWWLPFDADITVEPVAGGSYELRGKGGAPTLSWKVLRADAPHLFAHTHVEPGVVITWELSVEGDGCVLVLTQTVPDRASAVGNNFVVGLHTSLDRLGALLQGHVIEWDWTAMSEHQRRYARSGLAVEPE